MLSLKCTEIIGLFVKDYLTAEQFTDIFFDNINEFKNILGEILYYDFIDTNFNVKEQYISLKTKLTNFLAEKYSSAYNDVSDAFVEKIVEENNDDIVTKILAKRYIPKEYIVIDFSEVNSNSEFVIKVRDSLGFPQSCTNWNAIYDMIYDIIFPKKIIFKNCSGVKNRFADDYRELKEILNKASRIGKNAFTVEYQ